jgi:hypothetical protein
MGPGFIKVAGLNRIWRLNMPGFECVRQSAKAFSLLIHLIFIIQYTYDILQINMSTTETPYQNIN